MPCQCLCEVQLGTVLSFAVLPSRLLSVLACPWHALRVVSGHHRPLSVLALALVCSARDIQSQLPVEAKAFMHVDKQLREIMRKTKDRPNALQVLKRSAQFVL